MTTRTGERGKTRGAEREVPQRSDEFAHLSLNALRGYRVALTSEEGRVSYWRRLIQARMDLLELSKQPDLVRLERLGQALSETRVGLGRQALIEVLPVDDVPPLPDLNELWAREADPQDEESRAAIRRDLAFAELQLSAYRAALHRRLSRATGELIARYREEPTLCLSALPLRPGDADPVGLLPR
ncbi:MAG: hypothetical protein WAN48_13965 [Actinomycetes bacterium]